MTSPHLRIACDEGKTGGVLNGMLVPPMCHQKLLFTRKKLQTSVGVLIMSCAAAIHVLGIECISLHVEKDITED
eukprot:2104758-Ditylum_brightwellii.AAC.1